MEQLGRATSTRLSTGSATTSRLERRSFVILPPQVRSCVSLDLSWRRLSPTFVSFCHPCTKRPQVCCHRDPCRLERRREPVQEAHPQACELHQDCGPLLSDCLVKRNPLHNPFCLQESTSYDVKMDSLDLLSELLSKFGVLMVPYHQVWTSSLLSLDFMATPVFFFFSSRKS